MASLIRVLCVDDHRLMREGIPKDGRKLELMAVTARNRFSNFSDEEMAGLYSYLSRQVAATTQE